MKNDLSGIEASEGSNCNARLQGNMTEVVRAYCEDEPLGCCNVDREAQGELVVGCEKIYRDVPLRNWPQETGKNYPTGQKKSLLIDCADNAD